MQSCLRCIEGKQGEVMEISYRKDGSCNSLIIKELDIDENDYKFQMVINNNIDGLIPLSIKTINNKPEIHYKITSMISMESMYAKKQISGKDIYKLVRSINELSEKMKEYLLNINNIMFHTEFIYLKRQEESYQFCYCPEKTENFQESLREFFDKLLEYINHNDKKAVLIAYGIQQITLGDDFTIQDLMDCAEKNIKDEQTENKCVYKRQQALDERNQEEKIETNIERRVENRTSFFKNIVSIFKGKSKFKDETQLEDAYGEFYDSTEHLIKTYDTEEFTEESLEDATMLLTANSTKVITLKSTNMEKPMEIVLDRFPCVVGKSKKSSDFYLDSPVVSRVHMRISEDMAGYFVEDLNSTNGTFINGDPLPPHQPREIHEGDQITLANIDFIVE